MNTATIGRIVHYVDPNNDNPTCRAAIITAIPENVADPQRTGQELHLTIFDPGREPGITWSIPYHPGDPAHHTPGAHCTNATRTYPTRTWHWPEPTP